MDWLKWNDANKKDLFVMSVGGGNLKKKLVTIYQKQSYIQKK